MHTIVCIGAGRLAGHLMPRLEAAGHRVQQVYNRHAEAAGRLAAQLAGAQAIARMEDLDRDADLYFLTVSDDAIGPLAAEVAARISPSGILVHCSGTARLDVLPHPRRGVFYPLQSFSPDRAVPWRETPVFITTLDPDTEQVLRALAAQISDHVHNLTDQAKVFLHLAAVFANNFTNHMLVLAERICQDHGIPFEVLHPLMRETVAKAIDLGPAESQTGPAIRRDVQTVEKQWALLGSDPDRQVLYDLITRSIRAAHPSDEDADKGGGER